MRILLALFVSLSINSYEFKSYEAKFQFQAMGFSFPSTATSQLRAMRLTPELK